MPNCNKCGDVLTAENASRAGPFLSSGAPTMRGCCRHCLNRQNNEIRLLKKHYPSPQSDTPCAICGEIKPLVLDHCHQTGQLRGYICRADNRALGMLGGQKYGDSVEGVLRAVKYLQINARPQHSLPEGPKALSGAGSAWSESTSAGSEESWDSSDEGGSGTDSQPAGGEAGLREAPGRGGEDGEPRGQRLLADGPG